MAQVLALCPGSCPVAGEGFKKFRLFYKNIELFAIEGLKKPAQDYEQLKGLQQNL